MDDLTFVNHECQAFDKLHTVVIECWEIKGIYQLKFMVTQNFKRDMIAFAERLLISSRLGTSSQNLKTQPLKLLK